jgi:hypothetical protein
MLPRAMYHAERCARRHMPSTGAQVSPILFAMADAVLRERAMKAASTCGLSAAAEERWARRLKQVGWWRSCWPL